MLSLRKLLAFVGILIVIAAAVFAYFDYNQGIWFFKPKGLPLLQTVRAAEDLVPTGPIFYLSVRDGAGLWQKVKTSNFYAQASGMASKTPQKNAGSAPWSQSVQQLEQNLGIRLDEQNLLGLFGKRAVLAFYGAGEKAGLDGLLIAETDMSAKVWEFLVRLKGKYGKDPMAPQAIPYKGVEIFSFQSPGPKSKGAGFYAFVGRYLLASSRMERLKGAIDLALGAPLGKSFGPQVRKAAVDLDKNPFLVFVGDSAKAMDWVQNALPPAQRQIFELGVMPKLKGYGQVTLTASAQKGLLIKSRVDVDSNQLPPEQVKRLAQLPATYRSLAFVPEDAFVYVANNSFDSRTSWSRSRTALKEGPHQVTPSEKFQLVLQEELGVSIERDLVPLGGKEWAYALLPADAGSSLPVPQALIMLQVKDRAKVDRLLRSGLTRLIAKSKGRIPSKGLKRQSYQGVEITYLEIPQLLSPAYAVTKDFLLVATDKAKLMSALDIAAGKVASLDKNARFLEAKGQLSEKSNGVFFINGNKAADSIGRIVSVVASMNPALKNAQQQGSGLLQALELLRVAPFAVGESVNDKNWITSRVFMALADIPKTPKPAAAAPSEPPPGLLALLNPQAAPAPADKPGESSIASPGKVAEKSGAQRDPFRPVILSEKVCKGQEPPIVARTPLQRYDLDSLKLVGVLWGQLGNKALIQAPDGKGYTVTVNTLVGSRGGVIKEIQADRLIVEESRRDEFCKYEKATVTVPLRREGAAAAR